MTEILEGSDQKFNITIAYMVRVLIEKVNSIPDQSWQCKQEGINSKKSPKEDATNKNNKIETETIFDGLIRLAQPGEKNQ